MEAAVHLGGAGTVPDSPDADGLSETDGRQERSVCLFDPDGDWACPVGLNWIVNVRAVVSWAHAREGCDESRREECHSESAHHPGI